MHWTGIFTIVACVSTAAAHSGVPVPKIGGSRKFTSKLMADKRWQPASPEPAVPEPLDKRQNTDNRCGAGRGSCAEGDFYPVESRARSALNEYHLLTQSRHQAIAVPLPGESSYQSLGPHSLHDRIAERSQMMTDGAARVKSTANRPTASLTTAAVATETRSPTGRTRRMLRGRRSARCRTAAGASTTVITTATLLSPSMTAPTSIPTRS